METLFFEKNWIGRILAATIFLCLTISSIAAQTTGHFDGVWLGKNANGDLIINLEIDTEKKNVANSYKTNCFNAGFMTISTIEPNGNKSVLQTFELTLESQNTNSVIFKYKGGREGVDNSTGKCKATITNDVLQLSVLNNDGDDPLFISVDFSKTGVIDQSGKKTDIASIIINTLVLMAYIAMIVHMIYVNYKGVRYKKAISVEEMKSERIAQNKPEEMSEQEYNQAVDYLQRVLDTWTVVGQNEEGVDLKKPTKMKQINASALLLDQAIALQPTDQEMIETINELMDVINSNEIRYFDGSKPLVWLGVIVGIIFCFISIGMGVLTLISTGAYILASRTPVFLIEKRNNRGGGNIHNGMIAGIFAMIAGAKVRTIYKYSDGHKEYEDDHSQHWIALALGLVLLVVIASFMALWAIFNYLRNYVLYF